MEEKNLSPKLFGEKMHARFKQNYSLPQGAFELYGVKRGLRNSDGTGVVAGVTNIGLVHGYVLDEGEKEPVDGSLYYRGYNVADLIAGYEKENRFGFEEVAYILLFGELPCKDELVEFTQMLEKNRFLPSRYIDDVVMKTPSRSIMNKIASCVLSLYSYDDNPEDMSPENQLRQSIELVARLPVITAYAYAINRHYFGRQNLNINLPREDYSVAEDFLSIARPNGQFTPEEARVLDYCLVLHAEHGGGNNSAFACRVLSSTGTDIYSAIAAAIGALKGPKHGGANIKVIEMFDDIKANLVNKNDDAELDSYLMKIFEGKAGDGKGLVYGMGHAVYTISDPRAVLLKHFARDLAKGTPFESDLELLERIEARTPQVFADYKKIELRPLCANVDLYSGLVYRMLGIPEDLFTPMFAMARMTGWCAHRIEELQTGGKIIRPAYKSVSKVRHYIPIEDR